MFFCSYNTRGLNNKVSFYKDFIASRKLNLVALLETHVKRENANFLAHLVAPKFQWVFNYENHYNGRIWLGWDPSFWTISEVVTHSQHISCKISSTDSSTWFYASFIYAFNDYTARRNLWADLINVKTNSIHDLPWVLAGDFNVCLKVTEMSNSGIVGIEMREFQEIIEFLDLFDLNFSGKLFTWWDSNMINPIHKKLDRVLVNTAWVSCFPSSTAQFLSRGLSDHCPAFVHLGIAVKNLAKPFQVFQHILEHPEFISTVNNAWSANVEGDPWFILTSKLKQVKSCLKALNRSNGNLHEGVCQARNALMLFQENMPSGPSASMLSSENKLCDDLRTALAKEEVFLKQKSRVKWLELGDGNNSFFHRSCQKRWNSNKILALQDGSGSTVHSHDEISAVIVDYFQDLLGTQKPVDCFDTDVDLPALSSAQQMYLCSPFLDSDIYEVLKRMAKKKSPGPDGLSPEFYLAAWSVIGKDVVRGVQYFFDTYKLPRIINSVAVTLVPKCDNPSKVEEFRPISCCNTLYKCISKLLAGRIQKVISSLISPNQSAFVPNRIIGDNIMLVQAICKDYHKNDGSPRCSFKLDIHKAFDSLSWDFLFMTLEKMCFPSKFICWIKECITGCMVSIKVNGVLEGFFKCQKGLRQGDPLSPYLFVLSLEVLSAALRSKLSDSMFNFHWRTNKLQLSHVIFADDLFLFCKGEMVSISLLLDAVDSFANQSGLLLNKRKCQAFFCNVGADIVDATVQRYGFSVGTLPIKYLGLPLITGRLSSMDCAPLIQRLCRRIEDWSVRTLRYSGRLQLLTSVLQGIQGYWASYLFLPKGVLKKIQSLFAKFLWGGDLMTACHYKVAWTDCCAKKEEGGLGIRDLFEWNRTAILFQVWRLSLPSPSSLWILWVHSCMLKNKAFWTTSIPYKCPWTIRKILNHRQDAIQFLTFKVAHDSRFKLWHDPWLINEPLLVKFGRGIIHVMDSTEHATVQTWIANRAWMVSSSNDYRATEIRRILSTCAIGDSDGVLWNGDSNVKLKTVWESIRRRHGSPAWLSLIWNKFQIPSCSFISWLACRGRLSTKDKQFLFCHLADQRCVLCRSSDETTEHIFASCPYSFIIFRQCPFALNLNWNEWLDGNFFQDDDLTLFQKNLGYLFVTIAIYLIWRERNDRIHSNTLKSVNQLLLNVKRMFREKLYSSAAFRREVERDPTLSLILY